MKINLWNIISAKYKKYEFVELDYQTKIIKESIYMFLTNLLYNNIESFILLEDINEKEYIKEIEKRTWQSLSDITKNPYRQYYFNYLVNIDVWLGKTIISIISMEIIKEIILELYKEEFEKYQKNKLKIDTNNFLNVSLLNIINDEVTISKEDLDFPIRIIARKSICSEFLHILKWKNTSNFKTMPSWRNFIQDQEYDNRIFSRIHSLILFNLQSKWIKIDNVFQEYKWLFIVDEWGNDLLFHSGWSNNEKVKSWKNYVISLSANKNVHNYNIKTERILKTDLIIKKELINKKLYSFQDFLYKFIKIDNKTLNNSIATFENLKNNAISKLSNEIEELSNTKVQVRNTIQSIVNGNVKDIDKTIKEIELLKNTLKKNTIVKELQLTLNKIDTEIKDYLKELNNITRTDLYKIFTDSNLQYLQEKNTIVIYDNKYDSKAITKIKESFKDWEFKITSLAKFRNIDFKNDKGNVLFWNVKDISKWLNLQHFDAIVFTYIDEISLEDIYQWIWRLDRLGIDSEKEIILMSYNYEEEQIQNLIKKKAEFNNWTSLSVINSVTKITESKKIFELKNKIIEETTKTDNVFNSVLSSNYKIQDKKEALRLKDKIAFIQANKKVFQELLKTIDKQFEDTKSAITSLMGWNDIADLDEKYLNSVLTIL